MNDAPDNASIALLLADRVVRRVETHPVSTLLGAAGVGLVLARGLPDSVLRMGASLMFRTAAMHLLTPRDAARPVSHNDVVPDVANDDEGLSTAAQ